VFAVVTEATSLMEGDKYPSASLYIALIVALDNVLNKELEREDQLDCRLAWLLKTSIAERFSGAYSNEALIIATLLDPRFKENIFPQQFRDQCKFVITAKMREYNPVSVPVPTPTMTQGDPSKREFFKHKCI